MLQTFNKICNIMLSNFINIRFCTQNRRRAKKSKREKAKKSKREIVTNAVHAGNGLDVYFCVFSPSARAWIFMRCLPVLFHADGFGETDVCVCVCLLVPCGESYFDECEMCVWAFFPVSCLHIIHSFALSVRLSSRCYYEHCLSTRGFHHGFIISHQIIRRI